MNKVVNWLLEGDVSIQYMTKKYLLNEDDESLRKRIATEGFGKAFLGARNPSGHWGRGFYQVKWISSHYTLLDLKHLEIEAVQPIMDTLELILRECKNEDGSINESHARNKPGDICVNGMFLQYASYFGVPEIQLKSIVDYLLNNILTDGGFNCTKEAVHSSMHTTISVLEGMQQFVKAGNIYRFDEIEKARKNAEEFLLMHKLYMSDKTDDIIDKKWTMLSYPSRWKYDILRALVYFAQSNVPYDPRMNNALTVLATKKRKDGTWPVQMKHPGLVHFDLEKIGEASRFNTLRTLKVLKTYGINT